MKIEYILLWSLSCLVVYTDAAKVVDISHTSQGSPDFYLGDEVTFTCAAAGFSSIQLLTLVYNDHNTARSGCIYVGIDNLWSPRRKPFIGNVAGLDSPQLGTAYCESVAKAEGFSISVKVTITDATVNGKFFCRASDGADTLSSREISVTSVKVAPTRLTMSMPEDVVEDKEFEVECASTGAEGADPVSSYRYDIDRGGVVVPTTGNTYTPTVADRGGFTVTCTDTAHPNWKGGGTMKTSNTVTSKEVIPKYIDVKDVEDVEDTNLSKEFNPAYENHLGCAFYVKGNPQPDTFGWTQQGNRLEETSSILYLTATDGVTEETVTCVAGNGLVKNVTITWSIKWSSAVTTPTIPTTTTRRPIPPGPIVGSVSAVIAVIIASAVGCYCYKKRKEGQNSSDKGHDMESLKDPKSKTKLDNGGPKPKPRRSTTDELVPKAQAPQRPIDDPIIYADLVHDSPFKKVPRQGDREKKSKLTKPYPPPAEAEPVLYASIDHIKTRDFNVEPAIPTSMAPAPPSLYGNVED